MFNDILSKERKMKHLYYHVNLKCYHVKQNKIKMQLRVKVVIKHVFFLSQVLNCYVYV